MFIVISWQQPQSWGYQYGGITYDYVLLDPRARVRDEVTSTWSQNRLMYWENEERFWVSWWEKISQIMLCSKKLVKRGVRRVFLLLGVKFKAFYFGGGVVEERQHLGSKEKNIWVKEVWEPFLKMVGDGVENKIKSGPKVIRKMGWWM